MGCSFWQNVGDLESLALPDFPDPERREFRYNDRGVNRGNGMQLFVHSKAFEINWFALPGGGGRVVAVASTEESRPLEDVF